MNSNSAVVSGASGVIGSGVLSALRERGYSVLGVSLRKSDSSDLYEILMKVKPRFFFHCAAVLSDLDPLYQYTENTRMIAEVAAAIGRMPIGLRPRLVNISSAAEIGDPGERLVAESYICKPLSHYGLSKLCQTEIAISSARIYGFSCVCPRVFNIIGGPSEKNLFNQWIEQIKKIEGAGAAIQVGHIDIKRDFLVYDQVIEYIVSLALNSQIDGVVNVCSGEGIVLNDLLERIAVVRGVVISPVFNPIFAKGNPALSVVGDPAILEAAVGGALNFRRAIEEHISRALLS
ncbi:NAD-dependent epimerase/dehydratase family protein [Bdellovibrio bacteriovorus]|uniref:NAD-dependent epimerase/dehydratase family protein n=1 Tax=Bdellovibrio bacteriovorus TaxID=959 RepID=UPI0021CF397A|nr:NAD-dependent epimerase/dehydratase family protein [Bdellovibrio bacteriovorus]UXR66280.1 NAD-dependent epimerase/dehydratase family protein [Bdellovibrio bacteriovorus]